MQYEIHPKHLIRNLTIIGSFLWVMLGGMIADSMVMMGLATGVVLSVAILISLLRFSLQIEPNVLIYRISFRHHIFVEKEVKPEEIERIKFFRSGVNEKAAIIKRKHESDVRLVVLRSHHPYDLLQAFSEVHGLEVEVTKRYRQLESAV
ncbi:hypothetical protein [Halobacillus salinus]|uniref:hypothetical protein n=1 Tax=Halobacillus salinus TaxID=192814 RepID=UPI0009A84A14|nr:hypothetical protein [Halobacillus salinus]